MTALTLDTLLALERAGWDALCAGTGGSFYGRLMTKDGLMVLVNGYVMNRDNAVASLDGAPAWDGYEILNPRVLELAPDTAALIYRARARRGDEPPFEALMVSTYVLVDDEPRLAIYQQTTATH